jgi:phosphonate transport system substrate-binding protein
VLHLPDCVPSHGNRPAREARCRPSGRRRFVASVGSALMALGLLVWAPHPAAAGAPVSVIPPPDYYRLGVIPWQSPSKLANMFLPLADTLEQGLSHPVQFVSAPGYRQFVERLLAREYHVVYLNPLLYPRAREAGYRVVARLAGEGMNGILVARQDRGMEVIDQSVRQRRLRLALPSAEAYSAMVLREHLAAMGLSLEDFDVEYFGSQDSALIAVHSGRADVSGTCLPSLRSMPEAVRGDLRIVEQTPPQPAMLLAVRDDVPEGVSDALVRILIELNDHEDGRRVLRALGFYEGFAAASEADYLHLVQ